MMEIVIALLFLAKILLALALVFFGSLGVRRGKNYVGDVPDRVGFDPELRRKANKVIIVGGVCAFVLCLPPFLWSFSAALSEEPFPMVGLALLVVYSIVTTSALLYPFERIKKMKNTVNSR
ncbi:hypothetical protein HNR06_002677 [Nocardiopsis arvandica]|uniref:DUF3784 domain-containing protein n=1 Tax=Nocardiopsis sinuspersici TaxID=501010 RepID=A0A7Z0BIT9_9ACTN|nr:hypothetical protein [Nocardiopsis sinuspersici]NYH53088.1 hypothetical protein [Nocardiopsis sinuspersici]